MNLRTKQIIDQVELFSGKFISNITIDDLNNISELNIKNFDLDGNVLDFYLEDLEYFNNLKKLSFNDMIIDIDTLNFINKKGIEDLELFNCEIMSAINNKFDKVKTLVVEYSETFKEDYLLYFPNVTKLTFKGYKVTKELSNKIKELDLTNSSVEDLSIIEKMDLNELYISKDEYERNKDFYKKLLYVNVYENNNIYLVNSGDKNE